MRTISTVLIYKRSVFGAWAVAMVSCANGAFGNASSSTSADRASGLSLQCLDLFSETAVSRAQESVSSTPLGFFALNPFSLLLNVVAPAEKEITTAFVHQIAVAGTQTDGARAQQILESRDRLHRVMMSRPLSDESRAARAELMGLVEGELERKGYQIKRRQTGVGDTIQILAGPKDTAAHALIGRFLASHSLSKVEIDELPGTQGEFRPTYDLMTFSVDFALADPKQMYTTFFHEMEHFEEYSKLTQRIKTLYQAHYRGTNLVSSYVNDRTTIYNKQFGFDEMLTFSNDIERIKVGMPTAGTSTLRDRQETLKNISASAVAAVDFGVEAIDRDPKFGARFEIDRRLRGNVVVAEIQLRRAGRDLGTLSVFLVEASLTEPRDQLTQKLRRYLLELKARAEKHQRSAL